MKKFILKIILVILILGGLIPPVNYLLKANHGHYIYHMMNEMYECDENIDVLFLGSSHVYRSLDPTIADYLLNCKTFNAGSSSQGMNTSYYLLKEICSYHDVKTVYLDTYYGMANIADNDSQVFIISDFMRDGKNKFDLLYQSGGVETVINGFLTFRRNKEYLNIIKNLRYRNLDVKDYSTVKYDEQEYRGEGFVYSYLVADAESESTYLDYAGNTDLSADKPVSELYYESLINIINFCKDNDIELVLVNQPMPRKTTDYVVGYNNYILYLKRIANENEIEYWNFDLYKLDIGLPMKYYKDGGHLNGEGAEIYTKFFCDFVNDYKEGNIMYEDVFYDEY